MRVEGGLGGGEIRDVEFPPGERHDLMASLREEPRQLEAELPVRSGDERFHAEPEHMISPTLPQGASLRGVS